MEHPRQVSLNQRRPKGPPPKDGKGIQVKTQKPLKNQS
jgi:hypothetical protein